MRLLFRTVLLCIFLLVSASLALSLSEAPFTHPVSSSSNCAMWAQLISEDSEKFLHAGTPQQRQYYRERFDVNREQLRLGRCRDR